jgi:hypothetical protein
MCWIARLPSPVLVSFFYPLEIKLKFIVNCRLADPDVNDDDNEKRFAMCM